LLVTTAPVSTTGCGSIAFRFALTHPAGLPFDSMAFDKLSKTLMEKTLRVSP